MNIFLHFFLCLFIRDGTQYDGLFMKSLIPEWILSIFMQRNSFDRKTAIEKIASQKLQSDQNHEQYTSLINIRLDDTVNLTKM